MKKPSFAKASNKKMIRNALQVVLAGETNRSERELVIGLLDDSDYPHYVILFRGHLNRSDYKALYYHDGLNSQEIVSLTKLHGPASAPEMLLPGQCEKYFRYESGAKAFKEIQGIKGFTLTTDAVQAKGAAGKKTNVIY